MYRILFLGAGKRYSLFEQFYVAAESEGIGLELFTYELTHRVHVADIADVIVGLPFNSLGFAVHLREIVAQYAIDLVIPCMDSATVALSVQDMEQALVSDWQLCKTFNDKWETTHWFAEHQIPHPDVDFEQTVFPFKKMIIKNRYGYGSRDQIIVNSPEEFTIRRAELADPEHLENYIFQEFIEGPEYTIDCYVSTYGDVYCSPRERLLVSRGEVENSVTRDMPELVEACSTILCDAGFIGPITIQAIGDSKSGEWKFIEINPRFGGGCVLSIEAGLNMPRYIIREHLKNNTMPKPIIKKDLLMIRSSRETFFENYSG